MLNSEHHAETALLYVISIKIHFFMNDPLSEVKQLAVEKEVET